MSINGFFMTEDPLNVFRFADISSLITDYFFDNGRSTLTPSNSQVNFASVSTTGNDISAWLFNITERVTAAGDLFGGMEFTSLFGDNATLLTCDEVDASGNCIFILADNQDVASSDTLGTWPVVPVPAAVWLFGSGLIGLLGFAGLKSLVSK